MGFMGYGLDESMIITGGRWIRNAINPIPLDLSFNAFFWILRAQNYYEILGSAGSPSHSLTVGCQRNDCLLYSLRSTFDRAF
jgi:hypothetical protein